MILANIIELWNSAWPAALIMLGLGTVFAIILLIASEKLKVKTDPKVEQIQNVLPGIDCGACGYAGCSSYAKAVATNPKLIGACAPGGQKVSEKIAEVLNLQVSDQGAPQRPVVNCRATTQDKTYYAQYKGIPTCTAANAAPNAMACKFGCLGFGDCTNACKFDALHIIDGLAVVDYEKCTGCRACVAACPRGIIEMVPFKQDQMMVVACSNKEAGKDTRKMCKVGCIACRLCTKKSEHFTVEENLAKVEYEKYEPSEDNNAAMEKCPTKVILYRGKKS